MKASLHQLSDPPARLEDDQTQLTAAALSEVLREAIAVSSRQRYGPAPVTLADALEIARQLDIPEEQVRLAAQGLRERRALAERRRAVSARRRAAFYTALVLFAAAAPVILLFGITAASITSLLLIGVPAVVLGWRAFRVPVSEAEAGYVPETGQPSTE